MGGNRIVVVGGGASGLAAAVCAAREGAVVTILEHKDRVGKKILMTGNGRCNLTNMRDPHGKYFSSDIVSLDRIYNALARFGAKDTRVFFQELGLYTKEKRDGGVYPVSEQAAVVLDVLRSACETLGVEIQTACEVRTIHTAKNGGTVRIRSLESDIQQKETELGYDRLILATGGKAAPSSGSDGTGYSLARKLGHHVIEPLPALVQLRCPGEFFKSVAGVRVQCRIDLYVDGSIQAAEEGELQLTDYGISGIPVFQFSRTAARAIYDGRRCMAKINFIPFLSDAKMHTLCDRLDRFEYKTVEEFLSGLVHKKLAAMICRKHKIRTDTTIAQAGAGRAMRCVQELIEFPVEIVGANSFAHAQVCSGGVPLVQVDENFQSTICRHIYLVGELLDCDGICGGYNLQWAWTTGVIAGREAAK